MAYNKIKVKQQSGGMVLLLAIVGSIIILIFLFLAWFFISSISGTPQGNMYIDGVVLDSETNEPLPNTEVKIINRGWAFEKDGLAWDHDYIYPTTTDQQGRFHIDYRVGRSAHIVIDKEDYEWFDQYYEKNSNVVIKLEKEKLIDPDPV